jgi:hypothetical protein
LNFALQCLAAFSAMAALDLVFAPYIAAVAARQAVAASAWASAISFCNVFVAVSCIRDRRLIVPVVLGAFAGTWLAVTYI